MTSAQAFLPPVADTLVQETLSKATLFQLQKVDLLCCEIDRLTVTQYVSLYNVWSRYKSHVPLEKVSSRAANAITLKKHPVRSKKIPQQCMVYKISCSIIPL